MSKSLISVLLLGLTFFLEISVGPLELDFLVSSSIASLVDRTLLEEVLFVVEVPLENTMEFLPLDFPQSLLDRASS